MTAPTPEEFERHLHEGPTRVEFILARIADDEAPTWRLVPYPCPPGCCAPAGWVGSECRYCDAAPVFGGTVEAITSSAVEHADIIHGRSRVLAQCAAYRSIVATAEQIDMIENEWGQSILRALATIWADHQDYRPEWKP